MGSRKLTFGESYKSSLGCTLPNVRPITYWNMVHTTNTMTHVMYLCDYMGLDKSVAHALGVQ